MEPIRVELRNFTSYGEESIDLSAVRLAALVGPNGAGKSSIIDALTWALFGEGTKGGSKALDNYVRRGAQECRVTVDFALHGQVYRVVRHRAPARGKTLLELYRQDGDRWEPMSGKTVSETQQRIEGLLRMDYRTFTASSVILQGKADSLTADMTDQERKEVLARILGLDLWDRLQEAARERARQARAEAQALAGQVAQAEDRAARRAEVEAAIASLRAALSAAEADARQTEARAADLEARVRQRPVLEQQIRDLDAQVAARQRDRQQVEADIGAARADIERQQAILRRPGEIRAQIPRAEEDLQRAEQEAARLQAEASEMEVRAREAEVLGRQIDDLGRQITSRQADLEQLARDGRRLKFELQQHEQVLARAEAIRAAAVEYDRLTSLLSDLDDRAARYAELDRQARELERQVAAWDAQVEAETARLEAAIASADRQGAVLDHVPCAGTDLQPACPLLAGARKAVEEADWARRRLEELRTQQCPHAEPWQEAARARDALGYDPAAHAEARDALRRVEADARLLPVLEQAEQRVEEARLRLAELADRYRAVEREIADLRQQRGELLDRLASEGAAHALARARTNLQEARNREASARERLASLRQALQEAEAQAKQAQGRIAELQQRAAALAERAREIDEEIGSLVTRRVELEEIITALDAVEAHLRYARGAMDEARRREAEAREQLGRRRQELAEIERAEEEARALRQRAAEIERRALVYEVLDQAAGKRGGVPALIIESAVPQIEAIANDLLGRMAGGRLAVRLDTQVETKAGTVAEVLRITVLDQGQERPYQTYSGAERFMVDLALRVALSRFLAHRAGAEIKLLVLDEGLGALDGANRQQVMAAIQEAAREFSRVLVVTHIAELQDAFPQRIEVARGADGSRVRVVA